MATQSRIAVQLPTLNSLFSLVNEDGLTSGTIKGTVGSILKALELSITRLPAAIASGTRAFDLEAPAEKKATSTPVKAPGFASLISTCLPSKVSCLPTDLSLASNVRELIGNFRCSNNLRNSPPTAPVAPTIATQNDSRTPSVLP